MRLRWHRFGPHWHEAHVAGGASYIVGPHAGAYFTEYRPTDDVRDFKILKPSTSVRKAKLAAALHASRINRARG